VTLFDLSAGNLAFARGKVAQAGVTLEGFEQGTATDLSRFSTGSFDAVLLMGPLYHLLERAARLAALVEARRVLKPGGLLFAAFITRYAPFRWSAAEKPGWLVDKKEEARSILATGSSASKPGETPTFLAYYAHPGEAFPLLQEAQMEIDTVLAVEGLVSRAGEQTINELPEEQWKAWVDLNVQVATDPSIHGAVEHLLAVARKPQWRDVLRKVALRLSEAGLAYKVVGGASAALHGVPLSVKDIDIETDAPGAYQFGELYSGCALRPVMFSQSDRYRSHFGQFDIEGVTVEVMGDLHRREGETWKPTYSLTETIAFLDGAPVKVSWLEEETLAYIRRGRLDRAGLCLAICDKKRLLSLLQGEVKTGVL
jgi:hypothetical protein